MEPRFWKNRKVFITGHTGFKGSWLCLTLQRLGAEIVGYSLPPPTQPNLFNDSQVNRGMNSITGDVRDLDSLKKCIMEFGPDVVFHLAAQPLVRYSYENPIETYATNVMGTVNLLEAVRCGGTVKAVINITSDKCYENKEWVWGYRENDAIGGYDPYSNSKGCAELVTAAYRNSFFNPNNYSDHGVVIASVRAGNVIGGGDWATDRLIPDIIRAFSDKKSVVIRNMNAIRPWQHVIEPLRGYMLLAQNMVTYGTEYSGAWNFGPDDSDAKPVSWIIDKMTASWGGQASWTADREKQPHESQYLKLDCSKARQKLNWKNKIGLYEALDLTVDWYKSYYMKRNVRDITMEQIEQLLG